jgi:hypothetical protein
MRSARVVCVIVAGIVFVALTGCGAGADQRSPAVAVRTCSMVGYGGLAADYRRRALSLGPLALGNLRTFRPGMPLPGKVGGRYSAYEVIAIVNAGTRPTLTLPRSEWASVGLLYDPRKFRDDGAYRIRDLDQVVHFRACQSPSFNHGVSQFDGGFVVTHPQCVRFRVNIPGGHTYYYGEFPAAARCSSA